ncbi:MAG: Uma2 family endonuclease [Acidobacteria bacterium]|nr:Uma2 family endonuclease [Acidobacteriota bacterium]
MPAIIEVPQGIRADQNLVPGNYRFTVKDYYRMLEAGILTEDDRVELIRGEIRTMSPKGPKHSSGNTRANRYFTRLLGDHAIIRIQEPIHIDDYSEPEPDVVLAAPAEDFYDYHHPTPEDVLMVLEVADSSLLFDREEKSLLYAQAGVRQYCLLNLRDRELEDYRNPGPSGYRSKQTYTAEQSFNLDALPDVFIEVNALLPQPGKIRNQRKKK